MDISGVYRGYQGESARVIVLCVVASKDDGEWKRGCTHTQNTPKKPMLIKHPDFFLLWKVGDVRVHFGAA